MDDRGFATELERHLTPLVRNKTIRLRNFFGEMAGGGTVEGNLPFLRRAKAVLLITTAKALCEFYDDVKVAAVFKTALALNLTIVPVLVSAAGIEYDSTLKNLSMLPSNGKPVGLWANRDQAFTDIVSGVRVLAEQFRNPSE